MMSSVRFAGLAAVVASFIALAVLGRCEGAQGSFPFLWHGAGVALAVVFLHGRVFLGAVALGSTLASLVLGFPCLTSVLMGLGSAVQTEFAVVLLRRFGVRPTLTRLRDVLVLLGCGAFASGFSGGLVGASVLVLTRGLPDAAYLDMAEAWSLHDVVGVATMTPVILGARMPQLRRLIDDRHALFATIVSALGVGALLLLAPRPGVWFVLPVLMWLAIRIGPLGVSATLAVVGLVVSVAPDAAGRIGDRLLPQGIVQFATIGLSAASLSLAAAVSEARRSERRRLRIEAEEQAIRERGELREHLLAIVGHDLRGPLATVAAASRLLLQSEDASSRKLAAVSERATTRMSLLVEDLLDFARTRLSGISLVVGEHDLGEICERLLEEAKVSHPAREISLLTSGKLTGHWDGHRIEQMLGNIIGNALTHGEQWLHIEMTEDGETNVVIRVANGGSPIPQASLGQLFEPYRRGEQASQRTTPGAKTGLGLGLYIVREIAHAHGGNVDATSTVEEGTVFRVVLPRDSRGVPSTVARTPEKVEVLRLDSDDSVPDLSIIDAAGLTEMSRRDYTSVSKVRALEPARLLGPSTRG